MKKRGISTIVATVLIVLITVAAVTILWAALSPLIGENLEGGTGCFNVQDAVTIDADKTYTCINTTSSNGTLYVRIGRSAGSETLVGVELFLESGGETLNSSLLPGVGSLPENGYFVYMIENTTAAPDSTVWYRGNDVTGTNPVMVAVAPQILIDGEESSCTASAPIELRPC